MKINKISNKNRESGRTALSLLILSLLFSGCITVGPDYKPPVLEEKIKNWHAPLEDGLKGESPDPALLAQWWTTLNDPQLTDFILRALEGNLDLKEAKSRVRQARAYQGIAEADRFPTLNADTTLKKSRTSEDTGLGSERDLYKAGFDASWEIDLFGGIKRSVEAADANLEASRETLTHVWISLAAEVARNYIEIRSYQTRLKIAQDNLKAQLETFDMVQNKFQAGITDSLDVEQARYNLSTTRSDIPTLRTRLIRAQNRLAVLLGKHPGALSSELSAPKPIPITPLEVAVGIPANLLRRRPDVKQAEREIAAQTARIGVATANLYPKLTLTGSIGLEAISAQNLFKTDNSIYGIGPAFSWNIFNAGAIRQNIRVETALQEQAVLRYESAILLALEEVENALTAYAQEQLRRTALSEGALAAQRAVVIAQDQYQAGLTDFQNVLEAQRSLLSLQDKLAQSEETVTFNLVSLYKALGGGWHPLRPEALKDNFKSSISIEP